MWSFISSPQKFIAILSQSAIQLSPPPPLASEAFDFLKIQLQIRLKIENESSMATMIW